MRLNKAAISNGQLITDNGFGLTGLIKKYLLSTTEDG